MAAQSDPSDPELAAGTLLEGRWRILRPLGVGGTGRIYECEHQKTGARYAVKVADPEGAARLDQEAKATAKLKNPRAPRVVDVGRAAAGPFLVMELLEGQTLRHLLDDAGQLPLELVMNLVLQICECLAEAHRLGLVHRDLKPDNIFLSPSVWPDQSEVKVLDFGIVKAVHDAALPKSELTRTGSTVGTPYYMSLEQLRNPSKVDARADLYSLGVMVYECLSGAKPFVADTIGDLVYVLCSGPPPSLDSLRPDLPIEVCDVVSHMLSMKPDERPGSALDVALAALPHGNPAFGLWIGGEGSGGKRPALELLRARQKGAAAPPAQRTPPPTAVLRAVLARPDVDEDDRPRDTPTRMMFARPGAPGAVVDEQRPTPTEAIAAASRDEVEAALAARGYGNPEAPDSSGSPALTGPSIGGGILPLPIPGAPTFGVPVLAAPPKPRWQRTLDRWMEATGRAAEGGLKRFQRATPQVKLAILVGGGVVGLVFTIWFLWALLR